jgi:septum formation protein
MSPEPVHAPLILASRSPRRRTLLERAGLAISVVPSTVDEAAFSGPDPVTVARTLAEAKARQVARTHPDSWVIGADTMVVIDGRVLGKPASETEARAMLRRLSGQTHRVVTGWCVGSHGKDRWHTEACVTRVCFKTLTEAEIDWYVATGEPFDKAGAYAIQGIGTFLVRSIEGSYTNVVGLPVCEVIENLLQERILRYPGAPEPAEAPETQRGGQSR